MYEYMVKWNESACHQIAYISKKILIFQKEYSEWIACPSYVSNNSYLIKGIQFLFDDSITISIDNFSETDYQFIGDLANTGYKRYV